MVIEQGYYYQQVAKKLGTTGWSIQNWVQKFRQAGELPAKDQTQHKADELRQLRKELARLRMKNNDVKTLYVELGSPLENGYIESFNGKLQDEILNREVFYSVKEAKNIVEDWQMNYNHYRPHSGLDYMTSAGFAASCIALASPMVQLQQYTTEQVDNSLIRVDT